MTTISGWFAVGLLVTAATVPIAHRLRKGHRAAPVSKTVRLHVAIGLTTAAVVFVHTLAAMLSLGSPKAIGAGNLALAAGALAFVVLFAHTGLGLQLRRPKLRHRQKKRRSHLITAITITLAAAIHTVLLLRAAP